MRSTFEVHFTDGNVKLFEATSMTDLLKHLLADPEVSTDYIWKIEER